MKFHKKNKRHKRNKRKADFVGKPLEIENQSFYEKYIEIWQRIHTAIKIEYLLLACVPKNPICPEHDFSLFFHFNPVLRVKSASEIKKNHAQDK